MDAVTPLAVGQTVSGYCPACDSDTVFEVRGPWLRDQFLCRNCASIPRERALMACLETHVPGWRQSAIHESSPVARGASLRLSRECERYVASHYWPDTESGAVRHGYRCENLERLTFASESLDLHISQDVLEHVPDPGAAFAEIARTLKPGGAHIFTVPLVRRHDASVPRARRNQSGEVVMLAEPVYHGNPISDRGSLVTTDWGFDICRHIFDTSGMITTMVVIDDLSRGIRAELIEVLVSHKR